MHLSANLSATDLENIKRDEQLIQDFGYKLSFYTFGIGSRGFIGSDNASRIKSIFHQFSISYNVAKIKKLCS